MPAKGKGRVKVKAESGLDHAAKRRKTSRRKSAPSGPSQGKAEGNVAAAKTEPPSRPKRANTDKNETKLNPEVDVNTDLKEIDTESAAGPSTVPEIKRTLRFRKQCPVAINERADRVMYQRMFMIDRGLAGDGEEFKVLGSTGNVYTVHIGPYPSCDCPDCMKGNVPCKHIIFIFLKVLKVPRSSGSWYQRHILPDELAAIYAAAPDPATSAKGSGVSQAVRKGYRKAFGLETEDEAVDKEGEEEADGGKRLTAIGDDCPICFETMSEDEHKAEQLVFDLGNGGCGKPIHKECFGMWAATAKRKGETVTCVYCRHNWATPDKGGASVTISNEGYINLASVAGMSGVRDTSSYYHGGGGWRHQQMWETRYRGGW